MNSKPLIVGITGAFGSGKSTAAFFSIFERLKLCSFKNYSRKIFFEKTLDL